MSTNPSGASPAQTSMPPAAAHVSYLRLSITDRCNLRCTYCMPATGVAKLDHSTILRYEEFLTIVRAAVAEGVHAIRITGGEPLVRRGVVEFVRELAGIAGVDDISLTTNGVLLPEMARPLYEAGLRRVNISCDSLDPGRYHAITRCGELDRVLLGISAALAAGLDPVKVNAVVEAGVNDDEVEALARLAIDRPIHVRFIERMPFNVATVPGGTTAPCDAGAAPANPVCGRAQLLERLAHLDLQPVTHHPDRTGAGPAEMFAIRGGRGFIGLITPRSCPFCHACNRLRVTAAGRLKPCLKHEGSVSLRGLDEAAIRAAIQTALHDKVALMGTPGQFAGTGSVSLSDIGG